MRALSKFKKDSLISLPLIFLIWGVSIAPSFLNPHWSFLDVPTLLKMGEQISLTNLLRIEGMGERFFPLYFLYFHLLFSWFGLNLQGYYFIQAILFFGIYLFIYGIVLRFTQSWKYSLLAVFLFSTSSPLAENVYTIGKQEPLMLFFSLAILFVFFCLIFEPGPGLFLNSILWTLLFFLSLAMLLTKETSVTFLIFPLTAGILSYRFLKKYPVERKRYVFLFLALFLMIVSLIFLLFLYIYAFKSPPTSGSYVRYSIGFALLWRNAKIYLQQHPDVFGMAVLVLPLLLHSGWRKGKGIPFFPVLVPLFLTGIAYLTGHLLWRWPLGYYLLFPAAIFAMVLSIAAHHSLPTLQFKKALIVLLILLGVTRVFSISYSYFIAMAQSSQDRLYSEALKEYVHNARPGQRLIFEQWPYFVEQIQQTNILLQDLLRKEQLRSIGIQDLLKGQDIHADTLKLYNMARDPDWKTRLPQKGDFVLIFTGTGESSWTLRGIAPFPTQEESEIRLQGIPSMLVAEKTIQWKFLSMKPLFIPRKVTQYERGYRLYQIQETQGNTFWLGREEDLWIGKKAQIIIYGTGRTENYTVRGTAPDYILPNSLAVFQNGKPFGNIRCDKAGSFSFVLSGKAKVNEIISYELFAEKTFVPASKGLSSDGRNLSFKLAIERTG
jgi:hypothetical protein